MRGTGLGDTQATERFVYELEHLRGLIGSDIEPHDGKPEALNQILAELEKLPGSVSSVRIRGRKPQ